ncbi:hypothetical protein ACQJBY_021863 [Aegilops geniculata]
MIQEMFVMSSLLTIGSSHRQLEFLDGSCGLNRRWAPCAHASILLHLLSFGACGVCAHWWDGARRNSDAAVWMCGVGSGSSPAARRSGATLATVSLSEPRLPSALLRLLYGAWTEL